MGVSQEMVEEEEKRLDIGKLRRIIIKELHFDAAHYLPKEFGKCHNLHGHRYYIRNLEVITDRVVDFNRIKEVVDSFDHVLLIPETDFDFWLKLNERLMYEQGSFKIHVVTINGLTTVENIALKLKEMLEEIPGVISASFELYEGDNEGVKV